ncbi:diguanylate cyclase domain-containing protein [Compostimonas suwonensis]|uniref:Diguanylate cyclase with GGDEF domain n=1 Tax=Compostimonas suwonensis TaxID=1048394 RepID=A0A2M9BCH4_9MICO|nr:diguanylate cyclase [Compostimonas suwonensis]PJJ55622.1 diguanylate cyclase with GGDEF domain [Compostimonas suwonensis]
MTFDLLTLLTASTLIVSLCGVIFVFDTALRRNDAVGRAWSLAFLAGMLTTLSYIVWDFEPGAWWAVAVGNAAVVFSQVCMWTGARLYNGRSSMFWVGGLVTLVVAVSVPLSGDVPGGWAGGGYMIIGVALFAGLAGVESLRGRMRRSINATLLSAVLFIGAAYYLVRFCFFITIGPFDPVFRIYLGTESATFVSIMLVVGASFSLAFLRAGQVSGSARRTDDTSYSAGALVASSFYRQGGDVVERAARRGRRLFLVIGELNNLGEINTAFGRAAGDEEIRIFAEIFRTTAPETALIGRLTANRFVVLGSAFTETMGERLVGDIESALVDAAVGVGSGLRPTARFGWATTDQTGFSLSALSSAAIERLGGGAGDGRALSPTGLLQ